MKKFTMLLSLAGLLFVGCAKDEEPALDPFAFDLELPERLRFEAGETKTFEFTATEGYDYEIFPVWPRGWSGEVDKKAGRIVLTAPPADDREAEFTDYFVVEVNREGKTAETYTSTVTRITFEMTLPEKLVFDPAESLSFPYAGTGAFTLRFSHPQDWTVEELDGEIEIVAPNREVPGTIEVEVLWGEEVLFTYSAQAYVYLGAVTFETVPAEFLAGPTAYGENLYPGYEGGFVDSYTDPATGLNFNIPYDLGDGYGGYMLGGSAISQWNDRTTAGYTNQCSVWYSDLSTDKGGHGGSPTFAVVFAAVGMGPDYPTYIEFEEGAEKTIDHLYISNATYAYLSMRDGDAFAKQFTYEDEDWFKLTFQGYDAAGEAVGTPVEYYLADFRTEDAPGIVEGWHSVDLTPMGPVNRVVFSMTSSDGSGNMMNTPAYFCLDDIAVQQ